MSRVFLRRGLLGEDGNIRIDVDVGTTPRAIVATARTQLPASVSLQLARNGRLLEHDAELDVPLGADDDLIVSPVTTGIELGAFLLYVLVAAVVSVGINYAMQALAPRPKPNGAPQERGDASSPTYSWDGITTSYGQGWPVPVCYGRHGVGGQVIYSNANVAWGGTTDRLDVVLALSEGPVHRIGDVLAADVNNLGGIGGTPGSGPLPDGIYVNNTVLEAEANAPVRNNLQFTTWTVTPNLQPGAVLQQSVGGSGGPWVPLTQIIENLGGSVDVRALLVLGVPTPIPVNLWVRELSSSAVAQVSATSLVTRPNPTPGALAFLRPGTLDQSVLPADPFRGTSTTFAPALSIDQEAQEAVFAFTSEEDVEAVSYVFAAPAGCYAQDPQGNLVAYPVEIDVGWRQQGTTAWNSLWGGAFPGTTEIRNVTLFPLPKYGPQLQVVTGRLNLNGATVPGPIELRVRRRSPAAGPSGVSNIVWRNASFTTSHSLGYPRVALLGLSLAASARFNGGLPNFLVRLEGVRVRVWHPAYGWNPTRVWDAPTTGSWARWRWPVGRNPAWVLLDFLTAPWGLGKYVTDADLDLPSFFRWSVFCDQSWGIGSPYEGAEYSFDGMLDAPRPAWEIVLQICAAGRAGPVFRNGKIGVVYQYRDAHVAWNGITSYDTIPAKVPVQLITEGGCEKVQVSWLPKASRATSLNFQYLDEDSLWRQSVYPVQDSESTLDDPTQVTKEQFRPEVLQAFGVTRKPQLFREGVFRHRISRLVRREVSFVTGPWALAAEVGDLVEFEHEVVRPFDTDVPSAMMVVVGGDSVTTVVVDEAFSLPPSGYELVVRNPDGAPERADVTGATHTLVNGITRTSLTLASAVTCNSGAQCVLGLIDKTTQVYQVAAITLQQDLKRTVRLLQWVPEIYDAVTPADYEAGGIVSLIDTDELLPVPAANGLDDFTIWPQRDGTHVVAFSRSPAAVGRIARLYARETDAQAWLPIGSTEGDEFAGIRQFAPGHTYHLSLAIDSPDGDPPTPDGGVKHTFVAEEFPRFMPPAVSVASAIVTPAGELVVQWAQIDARDVDYYEVRVGDRWNGATPVYRGNTTLAPIRTPGIDTGGTALVALRATSGLFSNPLSVPLPLWVPQGRVLQVSDDDLLPSPAGTHSGTQWNSTDAVIELTGSNLTGTYTALELDATFQATLYWSVDVYARELDEITVEEAEDPVDSGEAAWRTVEGRAASPFAPGIDDWLTTVDDDDRLVDDCGDDEVHGLPAAVGTHARVLVESRFEVSGVYTAWAKHIDGPVTARKMQVRVVLDRESVRYQVNVSRLRFAAYL